MGTLQPRRGSNGVKRSVQHARKARQKNGGAMDQMGKRRQGLSQTKTEEISEITRR